MGGWDETSGNHIQAKLPKGWFGLLIFGKRGNNKRILFIMVTQKFNKVISLMIIILAFIGCVYVETTPETVKTMSDAYLCGLLGPMWVNSAEDIRVMKSWISVGSCAVMAK